MVLFPDEARAAIKICKYAPDGCRSLTAGLPQFCFQTLSPSITAPEANKSGSVVFIMIETRAALNFVDEIAALPGLGVLLVGANDLASDIGTLGNWEHPEFLAALRRVGNAAKSHNVIFGIAGLYHKPEIIDTVVNEFGARWVVGGNDVGFLMSQAAANVKQLSLIQK